MFEDKKEEGGVVGWRKALGRFEVYITYHTEKPLIPSALISWREISVDYVM